MNTYKVLRYLPLAALLLVTPLARAATGAETVAKSAADLNRDVQKIDLEMIPGKAAEILHLPREFLDAVVSTNGAKCSEFVYIAMLAEKTGEKPAKIFEQNADRNWLPALRRAGFSEEAVYQKLDQVYVDLAFALLDVPMRERSQRHRQ